MKCPKCKSKKVESDISASAFSIGMGMPGISSDTTYRCKKCGYDWK